MKFERSETTSRIVAYLASLAKGAEVTYSELANAVGERIESRSSKLTSARFILERDHNAIWICIAPKIGVRRLTDVEIADRIPGWWLKGARNKLRRGGSQADNVEIESLDLNQQTRFAVNCIQRELALDALSTTMRRRVERVARGTSNDLPAFNIVEWAITLSPRRQRQESQK